MGKVILALFFCLLLTPVASSSPTYKTLIIPHNNYNLTPALDVYIGEKGPFKFIIDTGATHSSISRSLAKELALPFEKQTSLSTETLNDISFNDISYEVDLYISKQKVYRKTDLLITDFKFNNFTKPRGILGMDQFQNGVLQNYPNEKYLKLTLPNKADSCSFLSKKSTCLTTSPSLPSIGFSLGKENGNLIIDTGNQASKAIILFKSRYTNQIWKHHHTNLLEIEHSGLSNKPIKLLRTPDFSLGDVTCKGEFLLKDPKDNAPLLDELTGLIGWSALESLSFKIDYKHNKGALKLNRCPYKKVKTLGINKLAYAANSQHMYVTGVIEESPAGQVGIKLGDKVEKIILADGKVITKFDNSIYQWNDQHVYARPGSKVTYFIRRDGELKPYVMIAEDINLVELE